MYELVDISIIIRTLNEGYYLPSLLEKIKRQECNYSYEVVLVDSGSNDNTLSVAESYGCVIVKIDRKDFSFGRSLNLGCKNAKGKYCVIISGHCVPYDNLWLENLVKPLASKGIAYSYGKQIGGKKTYWSEYQIFRKYYGNKSLIPQIGFFCNNANSAILKEVWEDNKFNEDITGLEDLELAKRISNKGFKIGYIANACVYHFHNETWKQVEIRFLREAIAMKFIFPEILISLRYTLSCMFIAIISDIYECFKNKKNISCILDIFKYRFYQYLGTFKGHKKVSVLNSSIRDSFYYPTEKNLNKITNFKNSN